MTASSLVEKGSENDSYITRARIVRETRGASETLSKTDHLARLGLAGAELQRGAWHLDRHFRRR